MKSMLIFIHCASNKMPEQLLILSDKNNFLQYLKQDQYQNETNTIISFMLF